MNDAVRGQFESMLTGYRERAAYVPGRLFESIDYCLSGGGKRIRPFMLIDCGLMFGAEEDGLLRLAAALEYIHTYSLIHDDLPAMDDDDFRRGKPSCHKIYGEAHAILTGDALLNLAFESLFEGALRYNSSGYLAACACISKAAGMDGMIGGQVLDIENSGKNPDFATYELIAAKKTGALFFAALTAGALAGGAKNSDLKQLALFAKEFGLIFQLVDDYGEEEGEKSLSAVSLFGKETVKNLIFAAESKARQALSALSIDHSPISAYLDLVLESVKLT